MKITISVKEVSGVPKKERKYLNTFTNYLETEFSNLRHLLNKDYIYSPFNFIGYLRKNENLCSNANFIVIDVDHTESSIYQCFNWLKEEGLNCVLGTTNNVENIYRYRVLLPLDREVTPIEYRFLIQGIKINGLVPDMDIGASCKPAGVFYSYANSTVLFNFNGYPLPVSDFIADPQQPEHRALEPTADVSDILHEFDSYQSATKGSRTKSLLHAAYRCLDYGLTDSQLEAVITYVNSRFLIPKDTYSVQRRVLQFIKSQRKSNDT